MRYKEWSTELQALHKKSLALLVDEDLLCESATIKGETHKVALGNDIVYEATTADKPVLAPVSELNFKHKYSASEPGWAQILGGLKTKIAMAEMLNPKILAAAAQPYLGEAVLGRLTGDDDIADNADILRTAAVRRCGRLNKLVPRWPSHSGLEIFQLPSPSPRAKLEIHFLRESPSIRFGSINSLRDSWGLLLNYAQIEATVKRFAKLWEPLMDFAKEAE